MDRRNFFKNGFDKIAGSAIGVAESHAAKKAKHWIRPPYAKDELDFLLACTRCSACIDICPHNVIFPLPISRGAEVTLTPALDLLNKGCHLCEDWPCVSVCEPGALDLLLKNPKVDEPEPNQNDIDTPEVEIPLLKLAIVSIDENICLPYLGPECGACKGICPIPDTLVFSAEKPSINQASCVGCGLCREICIADPKAVTIRSW